MMQPDTPLNLLTKVLAMPRGGGKFCLRIDEVIILTAPKLYGTQLFKSDNRTTNDRLLRNTTTTNHMHARL